MTDDTDFTDNLISDTEYLRDSVPTHHKTAIFREVREYKDLMKDRWEIIYNAVFIEFSRTIREIWFVVLTIFTWLWGIVYVLAVIVIYLNASTIEKAELFDATDFYDFYQFVFFFLVLHCCYVAAKNITQQKADRSITLYLCRPISKLDYLIIKFLVLVLSLTVFIIVPDVILFIIVLGLLRMPFTWTLEHLWVLGSILLYGTMIVSVFSLISLAIASSTKMKHWAIAGIFIFLFLTTGLALVMRDILENDYVMIVSPWDNLRQVGAPLFGSDLPYSFPWTVSFGMLVLYIAGSLGVLVYNINRVEVVE